MLELQREMSLLKTGLEQTLNASLHRQKQIGFSMGFVEAVKELRRICDKIKGLNQSPSHVRWSDIDKVVTDLERAAVELCRSKIKEAPSNTINP